MDYDSTNPANRERARIRARLRKRLPRNSIWAVVSDITHDTTSENVAPYNVGACEWCYAPTLHSDTAERLSFTRADGSITTHLYCSRRCSAAGVANFVAHDLI